MPTRLALAWVCRARRDGGLASSTPAADLESILTPPTIYARLHSVAESAIFFLVTLRGDAVPVADARDGRATAVFDDLTEVCFFVLPCFCSPSRTTHRHRRTRRPATQGGSRAPQREALAPPSYTATQAGRIPHVAVGAAETRPGASVEVHDRSASGAAAGDGIDGCPNGSSVRRTRRDVAEAERSDPGRTPAWPRGRRRPRRKMS